MELREPVDFPEGLAPTVVAEQLQELGVSEGSTVLVHSSLRKIGPIQGGGNGLLEGIQIAIGSSGAVMVVSFCFDSMDPACHWNPPKPEDLEAKRREIAPLSVAAPIDPCLGMFPRIVWRTPGAARSPCLSFVALGNRAEELVTNQDMGRIYGPNGAFGGLSSVNGWVLYAGVGFEAATSVHRAEDHMDMPYLARDVPLRIKIADDEWSEFPEGRDYGCSANFKSVLSVLQSRGELHEGKVGKAHAFLVRHDRIVEAAIFLLESDQAALLCSKPGCEWCARARRILAGEEVGSNCA